MNLRNQDLRRALLAGIFSTLILTAMMYTAPLAGLPGFDMASAIGGFLDRPAESFSLRWWLGLGVFFFVGIVVYPIGYLYAEPMLIGNSLERGLEWGLLLWAAGGVCVMYFLGFAFHPPFTTHPFIATETTFAANLVYGVSLGIVMGHRAEPAIA